MLFLLSFKASQILGRVSLLLSILSINFNIIQKFAMLPIHFELNHIEKHRKSQTNIVTHFFTGPIIYTIYVVLKFGP